MTAERPNILFIQADQLAAAYLGSYGHPLVKSPWLDRLAARGVVFEQAHCNFPLCAPSRFSMLSGRLASTIAAYDNGAELPSSIPTFVHYLRHIGYQTCLVGKMHFVGADQLHGFEQRLTTDIYPADFGWTGDWTEVTMGQSNNDSTFTQAGIVKRNVQLEYDEEVVHRARRKLYALGRRDDKRPFFLTVSLTHPHDPYQCLQEHWERYDHEAIDMPVVGALADDQTDPYSRRLRAQYGLHQYTPDAATIRTARHAYYGSISYLDDQVGRILQTLNEVGLADNTIVVFTSDHGDMLGERGLWYKKCFYQNSIRVPLIIAAPGIAPGRVRRNVSLLDLFPTVLELAAPTQWRDLLVSDIEGASLVGLLTGDDDKWNNVVYCESLAEGANAAILMVRQGRLKYIVSGIDPEQLFDLTADPHELNNLAADADYRERKNLLKELASIRWDIDRLSQQVRRSQQERLLIAAALGKGRKTAWDYRAPDQAAEQCLRPPQTYNRWAYASSIK